MQQNLLKKDEYWQLNKKSIEIRTCIKEKNQRIFQDLSVTLARLNHKLNYKMSFYKHTENEFKEHHLHVLQKRLLKIKSHLTDEELNELSKNDTTFKTGDNSINSLYSRIAKKINFEPHYEQDWEFIENFLLQKSLKNKNEDNDEKVKRLESDRAVCEIVSLPSIASNYFEDDGFFFKSKKANYQKIYMYKKLFYERQTYEMKANEFSTTNFSCHKSRMLPKISET
jgi:hypothetical protein